MACRLQLQVGRQLMCRYRNVSARLLSVYTSRPSLQSNVTRSVFLLPKNTKFTASSIHTTAVTSSNNIVTIQDDKDFDTRVLKSETPVIVDFFAQWCGPCKILIPRLETLVSGKDGKVILAKIDIDEHTELAMNYEVQAVPTVIAMKGGKVIDKFVGLKDDADLETFVQKLIG